jgi:hypothetical protein
VRIAKRQVCTSIATRIATARAPLHNHHHCTTINTAQLSPLHNHYHCTTITTAQPSHLRLIFAAAPSLECSDPRVDEALSFSKGGLMKEEKKE